MKGRGSEEPQGSRKGRSLCTVQRRQWHPTPGLLPGKSHGQRSLVGCSLWGCKESDMTEHLHFHFSLSCTAEANGNPLQCSCLENPRDGGVWWAAIYGVTQSLTQLKWLSSSLGENQESYPLDWKWLEARSKFSLALSPLKNAFLKEVKTLSQFSQLSHSVVSDSLWPHGL